MPHPSSPDSVTGPYWGTLQATVRADARGGVRIRWRAEGPWEWPSYESLDRTQAWPAP